MKDPLTHTQHEEILALFAEEYHRKYQQALSSGAIDEEFTEEGDFTIAKCVIQLTAEGMRPLSPKARKLLKNLECFI